LSGEEDCGEANNQGETSHHGVAVTKTFRDETVDEQPNDFSNISSLKTSCQCCSKKPGHIHSRYSTQLAIVQALDIRLSKANTPRISY
jgi:hypothetical protein